MTVMRSKKKLEYFEGKKILQNEKHDRPWNIFFKYTHDNEKISLNPLKMITPCNGDFFTPIIITSIERCDKGAGC